MRSLRVALLADPLSSPPPHPRLSASLFSPPVPPLRARLPAGEVKEKLTDLRKTNLAVNPTSNRRPCLNSRDGEQRAPAAGNPASSFSQALHPTPHTPGRGREGAWDGRCSLQEAVGMGGWWEGSPFIPFPSTSV